MTDTPNLTPTDVWPTKRGQRMVPDPVTGEPIPYQRTSTFAKTLNPHSNTLGQWLAWRALLGAQRPEAHTLVQKALHAEKTPGRTIDDLAEIGGSRDAAQKGTNRHELLAAALHGHDLGHLPPEARIELDSIVRLIHSIGEPLAVEFNTVCDDYRTAGTADLLLRDHQGNPVVVDFKTGSHISRLEWSLQLIAHARAWHWADNQRTEPVAWSKPRLAIIHAPQSGEPPQLIELDTDQARQAAELACQVRDLRKAFN